METREKIIETMYDLTVEKGYDKASIGQICEIIGIKKPSVYYYFRSKEEIFLEMCDTIFKDSLESFEVETILCTDEKVYKKRLESLVEMMIIHYQDDSKMRKLAVEIYQQATRMDSVKQLLDVYLKQTKTYLHQVLEHGKACGALDSNLNVKQQVDLMLLMLLGMDSAIAYDIDVDLNQAFKDILDELFKTP